MIALCLGIVSRILRSMPSREQSFSPQRHAYVRDFESEVIMSEALSVPPKQIVGYLSKCAIRYMPTNVSGL